MSQNGNVRSKLAVKNSVYGIWSLLLDPACTEIMAGSGLDFIIFDGEHGTASLSRIEENVRILKAFNCDAIVRPSKVDPVEIQRILDIGVQGILVPQVRTREDVELVVKSACLAPDGVRGYNPFTRAGHYCGNGKSEFFQNDKTIVGVLIENKDAVTNIDDILNVMGLDLIYIGVFDLSCALGVPGDVSHVKVNDMIAIITQKAVEKNISVGLMVDSKASSFRFQPLVNFFVFKPDTAVFGTAIQKLLEC